MVEINKYYNENCIDTMKKMDDNFIDLTVTSPPYDSLREYKGLNFDDFKKVADELYRVTKKYGVIVWIVADQTIKGSESGTSFRQALYFKEIGFYLHDTMIYQRMTPYSTKNRYLQCFEYMFVLSKDGPPKTVNLIEDRKNLSYKMTDTKIMHSEWKGDEKVHREYKDGKEPNKLKQYSARENTWKINATREARTQANYRHPAIFPYSLARDHIITWSNAGELVYDCFAGSGTTLIAAFKNNRNYIGSEISEEYCQMIRDRFDDYKNKKKHEKKIRYVADRDES
jgi:site-specific DNA-methyltransferase (adenine-specific)